MRVLGLKQLNERGHERLRLGRVVAAEVANVHIHSDRLLFRPGVKTHMGFRQQHRCGESAGRRACLSERVKQLGHGLQTRVFDCLYTPSAGGRRIREPVRVALAAMKIGGEMKSLHGETLRQFIGRTRCLGCKNCRAPGQWAMLKTTSPLIRASLVACWLLAVQTGYTAESIDTAAGAVPRGSWATAPRHSAGIAPDPAQLVDVPIVQIYAARTYGWRGYFAVHPWIIYKRKGESAYTRYDVVGWRSPQVVQRNYAVPDGLWFGSTPELLVDHRGEAVEAMIDGIEAAVASYPYANEYRSYPGPNSNTFMAHIGREVQALKLDLPPNAIGKDYRPLANPVGLSSSGTGVQVAVLGLLGVSVGLEEGLEFNVLGLNFGIDFNSLALRLPFFGRVGFNDVTPHPPAPPAGAALAGK